MKSIDIAICHSEPGAWDPPLYQTSKCPPDNAKIRIGRTMFETDRTPKGWVERLNKMDEIWVPTKQVFWSCKWHTQRSNPIHVSRFMYDIFHRDGVLPQKLRIVPEPVDVDFFNPEKTTALDIPNVDEQMTMFLSIFKYVAH